MHTWCQLQPPKARLLVYILVYCKTTRGGEDGPCCLRGLSGVQVWIYLRQFSFDTKRFSVCTRSQLNEGGNWRERLETTHNQPRSVTLNMWNEAWSRKSVNWSCRTAHSLLRSREKHLFRQIYYSSSTGYTVIQTALYPNIKLCCKLTFTCFREC